MSRRIIIPWDERSKKSLALILKPYEATVVSKNVLITLLPREIKVVDDVDRFSEEESSRKRYVRVFFRKPIEPINEKPEKHYEGIFENYEVRFTNLGFSKYLTIIVPGSFLYNYVVLSENSVSIECSIKKTVYFEKIKSSLTIYFV